MSVDDKPHDHLDRTLTDSREIPTATLSSLLGAGYKVLDHITDHSPSLEPLDTKDTDSMDTALNTSSSPADLAQPDYRDRVKRRNPEKQRVSDTLGAQTGYAALLSLMGRDLTDPAVVETPARAVKAMLEIAQPIDTTAEAILSKRFESSDTAPVFVGPVPFVSLCEHHLLPFIGRAWVAYQPDGAHVVGLSKLARLVKYHAKRPQIQEGMTQGIVTDLMTYAPAQGAFVFIEGQHSCMSLRGVNVQGSDMITYKGLGSMGEGTALFDQMLNLVAYSRR